MLFIFTIGIFLLACSATEDLQGDNLCKENSTIIRCCTGYMYEEKYNKCVECRPGYIGLYCNETCQPDYYGRLCENKCNCLQKSHCHFVCGCVETTVNNDSSLNTCDGTMDDTTQTFNTRSFLGIGKDGEENYMMPIFVPLALMLVFLIFCSFHLYCYSKKMKKEIEQRDKLKRNSEFVNEKDRAGGTCIQLGSIGTMHDIDSSVYSNLRLIVNRESLKLWNSKPIINDENPYGFTRTEEIL